MIWTELCESKKMQRPQSETAQRRIVHVEWAELITCTNKKCARARARAGWLSGPGPGDMQQSYHNTSAVKSSV